MSFEKLTKLLHFRGDKIMYFQKGEQMKKVLLLLSVLTCAAFSQSVFLEEGKSGVLLKGTYANNFQDAASASYDSLTGASYSPSLLYSFQGLVDAGLSYSYTSLGDDDGNYTKLVSGEITVHVTEFLESSPVGFQLGTAFSYGGWGSDPILEADLDYRISTLAFTAGLYKVLPYDGFKIVPSYDFTYTLPWWVGEKRDDVMQQSLGLSAGIDIPPADPAYASTDQFVVGLGAFFDETFKNAGVTVSVGYLRAF
jgi:hypothetical protein